MNWYLYIYYLALTNSRSNDTSQAMSTPRAQYLVSKYYSQIEGVGVLREMSESEAGPGKLQDKTQASYCIRK